MSDQLEVVMNRRCDACGTVADYLVLDAVGNVVLTFCGHHKRQHVAALPPELIVCPADADREPAWG